MGGAAERDKLAAAALVAWKDKSQNTRERVWGVRKFKKNKTIKDYEAASLFAQVSVLHVCVHLF